MDNQDYIEKQFAEHLNFVNSIKKAPSISNEFYHPKTGERITFNQQFSLVKNDAQKRAKRIVKKLNS